MNLVEAGVVQFVFPLYSCQVKWKEEEEKTKKKGQTEGENEGQRRYVKEGGK